MLEVEEGFKERGKRTLGDGVGVSLGESAIGGVQGWGVAHSEDFDFPLSTVVAVEGIGGEKGQGLSRFV